MKRVAWFWPVVVVFMGSAVYLLWAEHRAHIMGALPYVLLLVCVGAHFLIRRSDGGHNH